MDADHTLHLEHPLDAIIHLVFQVELTILSVVQRITSRFKALLSSSPTDGVSLVSVLYVFVTRSVHNFHIEEFSLVYGKTTLKAQNFRGTTHNGYNNFACNCGAWIP